MAVCREWGHLAAPPAPKLWQSSSEKKYCSRGFLAMPLLWLLLHQRNLSIFFCPFERAEMIYMEYEKFLDKDQSC